MAVGATLGFSFVVTFAILKVVQGTVGLRVTEADEVAGIDLAQHSEAGYAFTEGGGVPAPSPPAPAPSHVSSPVRVPQGGEA